MISLKSFMYLGALALMSASNILGSVIESRQSPNDKLVFAHFMIGIVGNRNSPADYDMDMQQAKAYGIDAFALNIGVDPYTDRQLELAYQSAANNGVKVFISFDFNWFRTDAGAAQRVGQMIAQYGKLPAQLRVGGKVFASSFAGDGFPTAVMRAAAASGGVPEVLWMPNFHPGQGDVRDVDGALNWMGWDNNGNNKAPSNGQNVTVTQGDQAYRAWLGGKPYVAPVSPWFFTHFGPEVPYSKNWAFPGDLLWYNRWVDVLTSKPEYIELVTWNDYGESHYIGPLASSHNDDGASKWVNDMPHLGWLEMARPFIAAYKAGASSVNSYIQSDQLIYWYRPMLRDVNCDATDTTMSPPADNFNFFNGKPNGWETLTDNVFVVSLLKTAGRVTVSSGTNTRSFDAPAGAAAFQVPLGVGRQSFSLSRNGGTVLSDTSLRDVSGTCTETCGVYNFNAFVGSVPASPADPLGPAGLNLFAGGLKVACAARPSLPITGGPAPTAPPTSPAPTPTSKPPTTSPPPTPPTTTTTTTTSTTSKTSPPSSSPTASPGQVCVQGQVAPGMSGNYIGLCSFSCHYGYCPPGPCVCTAYGQQVPAPATNGRNGCPAPGLDASYSGLCSFSCNHDYCPGAACTYC